LAVEIERKFLIRAGSWREGAVGSDRLRDGLIARFGNGKVRVRIAGSRACITVKGPRTGISRPEFEYDIPLADAERMLGLCDGPVIEKTRYAVPHLGRLWTVDVYHGLLSGIEIAEIELTHEDETFPLPSWAGEEVTFDRAYRQEALVRARLKG
jgi:CYTH domain-containing protein